MSSRALVVAVSLSSCLSAAAWPSRSGDVFEVARAPLPQVQRLVVTTSGAVIVVFAGSQAVMPDGGPGARYELGAAWASADGEQAWQRTLAASATAIQFRGVVSTLNDGLVLGIDRDLLSFDADGGPLAAWPGNELADVQSDGTTGFRAVAFQNTGGDFLEFAHLDSALALIGATTLLPIDRGALGIGPVSLPAGGFVFTTNGSGGRTTTQVSPQFAVTWSVLTPSAFGEHHEVSDDDGGMFLVNKEAPGLVLSRVSADGGVSPAQTISAVPVQSYQASRDGVGGLLVVWSLAGSAFISRFDSNGAPLWQSPTLDRSSLIALDPGKSVVLVSAPAAGVVRAERFDLDGGHPWAAATGVRVPHVSTDVLVAAVRRADESTVVAFTNGQSIRLALLFGDGGTPLPPAVVDAGADAGAPDAGPGDAGADLDAGFDAGATNDGGTQMMTGGGTGGGGGGGAEMAMGCGCSSAEASAALLVTLLALTRRRRNRG